MASHVDTNFCAAVPPIGRGSPARAPQGYKNKGLYPAGLNEENCPNFPFCHWVP